MEPAQLPVGTSIQVLMATTSEVFRVMRRDMSNHSPRGGGSRLRNWTSPREADSKRVYSLLPAGNAGPSMKKKSCKVGSESSALPALQMGRRRPVRRAAAGGVLRDVD